MVLRIYITLVKFKLLFAFRNFHSLFLHDQCHKMSQKFEVICQKSLRLYSLCIFNPACHRRRKLFRSESIKLIFPWLLRNKWIFSAMWWIAFFLGGGAFFMYKHKVIFKRLVRKVLNDPWIKISSEVVNVHVVTLVVKKGNQFTFSRLSAYNTAVIIAVCLYLRFSHNQFDGNKICLRNLCMSKVTCSDVNTVITCVTVSVWIYV